MFEECMLLPVSNTMQPFVQSQRMTGTDIVAGNCCPPLLRMHSCPTVLLQNSTMLFHCKVVILKRRRRSGRYEPFCLYYSCPSLPCKCPSLQPHDPPPLILPSVQCVQGQSVCSVFISGGQCPGWNHYALCSGWSVQDGATHGQCVQDGVSTKHIVSRISNQ